MSNFQERLKMFNAAAQKNTPKEPKKIEKEKIGNFSGKNRDFLNKINQNEKDIKTSDNSRTLEENKNKETKVEFKSITDRIKNFEGNQKTPIKIDDNNNNTKNNISIKDRINKINQGTKNTTKSNQEKPKILPGSDIISNENPNMVIYKYPNIKFSQNVAKNCKILLFLGNNQDKFINIFINGYSDISFSDKFRYKIEAPNSNDNTNNFIIYNIKARTAKYNIQIVSFPYFNQKKDIFENYQLMKELFDLIEKKIYKRIHYIYITIDEREKLKKNEIIFFYLFINLFKKESFMDKINILLSPDDSNDNPIDNNDNEKNRDIINNLFNNEKNDFLFKNLDINFSSLFTEFFYINNKIIYKDNENPENEKEWKLLIEEITKIQNKIADSKIAGINDDKISFMNNLFSFTEKNKKKMIDEIDKYNRNEKIIFLNYLLKCNLKNDVDISILILYLYNTIENKNYHINNSAFNCSGDKNFNNKIYILSKIKFNNLQNINCDNCDLDDEHLIMLGNLFTNKLESLNLSYNKITEINILNKENIFINLENLDLSKNNISNINVLNICKFDNLKKLDLSYNKIFDIDCLKSDNLSLKNLEAFDLSYNDIKQLNKINVKSIKTLDILNNDISSGINDFSDNLDIYNNIFNKLALKKNNNELIFHYSKINYNQYFIKFKYLIDENDINNLLEKIKFKGIEELILRGFNNIDFLSNETLNNLKKLDLKENNINDISILNKIHFIDINKIIFNSEIFTGGYNSLNKFDSIKVKSIDVSYKDKKEKYLCSLSFYNPEFKIKFIFDNLNLLKDDLLAKNDRISISQEILDDNLDFFSYEEIKKSFPMFKNIESKEIEIKYRDNKYIAKITFQNPNFRIKFIFDDLNFLKDEFLSGIEEISIQKTILDDNLDFFSYESIKNNSFPIFKKLVSRNININYKDNKYHYYCEFNKPNINFKFILDNLDSLRDDLFKETKEISIANVVFNDNIELSKKKFANMKRIKLENNTINNIEMFLEIQKIKNDYSISLKIESILFPINLLDEVDKELFVMDKIELKEKDIKISYSKPFNFYTLVTINKLNELKLLKWCKSIDLQNYQLTDNDLNFLKNETLIYLENINLDGNKITNLNFLDKIQSLHLKKISIKNNLINDGVIYINNNIKKEVLKDIEVKIKEDNDNIHILSLSYNSNSWDDKYKLYFDYLYDSQKNLDILKDLNLTSVYTLNLTNINLKNIDFAKNKTLHNLDRLYLDSNKIEDISIFSNDDIGIRNVYNLSMKDNPIRKGLNALNSKFFKKSFYFEVSVNKIEKEFKISVNYISVERKIEFFINNIEDIINILDFKTTYFKIKSNNIEELNKIENEIKSSESPEKKKELEILLYIANNLKNNNNIKIINDNNQTEFYNENKLIINDNNAQLFENVFKYLKDKKHYYYSSPFNNIRSLDLYKLNYKSENYIKYLPFSNLRKLTLYNCNFDLNVLESNCFYWVEEIDLSNTTVTDIKGLCKNVPYLEILNLSNNKSITNLNELKNARFKDKLKKLYLSNNDLSDLNVIEMKEFEFLKLLVLDLSHNRIKELSTLSVFRNLQEINLEYNSISDPDELRFIIDLNKIRKIRIIGNAITGRDYGIFRMVKDEMK